MYFVVTTDICHWYYAHLPKLVFLVHFLQKQIGAAYFIKCYQHPIKVVQKNRQLLVKNLKCETLSSPVLHYTSKHTHFSQRLLLTERLTVNSSDDRNHATGIDLLMNVRGHD